MPNDWGELIERMAGQSWGPRASRITFGSEVLADLVAGLYAHSKATRRPVVVGCVYMLTSMEIVSALSAQQGVCVVLDKGYTEGRFGSTYRAIERLHEEARPLWSGYLPGFDLVTTRVDGEPAILGPRSFPVEEIELGPVRVAGFVRDERTPIVHAKVAVCCEAWIGEDEFGMERRDQDMALADQDGLSFG